MKALLGVLSNRYHPPVPPVCLGPQLNLPAGMAGQTHVNVVCR